MIPQYQPVFNREALAKEISDYILGDGYFTEYKQTEKFEQKIAQFLGVNHCITTNNGTISLSLALLAQGVNAGDHVLIPNLTMFATQAAVELIGAKPIFVDVDPRNLCLDLEQAKKIIEEAPLNSSTGVSNIKACIYVSLNGRSHKIDELENFEHFCVENHIVYLEDNAQSLGSKHSDNEYFISCPLVGIGSFSFSMPKIITTGQGGCLVTNNDKLARKIRKLKDFGRSGGGNDIHDEFGINNKFTEIQAIIGINQLQNINERIEKKKWIYKTYYDQLKEVKQIKFLNTNLDFTTPWFVDIFVEDRNKLQAFLKEMGIGTRNLYPALTSQEVNTNYNKDYLPVSELYSTQGVWLPSSLLLTHEEIKFVCDKIKEFYK